MKLSTKNVSKYAIQRLLNTLSRNIKYADKKYYCLLYTSDAADEEDSVDLGGRRIIKKKYCNKDYKWVGVPNSTPFKLWGFPYKNGEQIKFLPTEKEEKNCSTSLLQHSTLIDI